MKRDANGKFIRNWASETKQRISISLTHTAWRSLDQIAQKQGISRSEVIEQLARLEADLQIDKDALQSPTPQLAALQAQVIEQQRAIVALEQQEQDLELSLKTIRDRVQQQTKQTVEQKAVTILESISDAFIALDREWRFAYINHAAAQIFRTPSTQWLGKHVWQEVFPSEVGKLTYRELHRAIAEQTPISWEEFSQPIQRWLEVNAYPSPEGVVVYFRDVTERKQAETERDRLLQELETERSRFEIVLQQMPAGVMIADATSGKLVLANEQAKRIVGYSHHQTLELEQYDYLTSFIPFWATGDYNPQSLPLMRSLQTGEVIADERVELCQLDGSNVVLSLNSAPVLNRQGRIVAAVMVFQDVTDRHRVEAERQQTEKLLHHLVDRTKRLQRVTAALAEASTSKEVTRAVVEQSMAALNSKGEVIVLLTDAGDELLVSDWAGDCQSILNAQLNGQGNGQNTVSRSAPIALAETVRTGRPIFLGSRTEILKQFPAMAESISSTEDQAIATIPLIVMGRTLGGFGISFATPQKFHKDDRTFILTLAQQCAQAIARSQLYEAEQRARASAEAANRAKDDFLAVLSHELRTPLNPILGWTQLLQQRKLDANATAIALQTIERNAKIQVQLIEDLLDISRILQGKLNLTPYPVDLVSTIQAAIATVHLAAEAKSICIQFYSTANIGIALGDSGRLQQVLWNLLSNAVKFTPPHGQVDIYLSSNRECLSIQICDNGRGINPDFLPYIFDYFQQADNSITRTFGGLGLGLAIARHIVELHGGTIQAKSAGEGQGATFTVMLPILEQSEDTKAEERKDEERKDKEQKPNQEQPSHPHSLNSPLGTQSSLQSVAQPSFNPLDLNPSLAGLKVLVIDDEIDNLELITFVLEQVGAIITIANSALEGIKQFQQAMPDIVLADIAMPDMDGYSLLRHIRSLPVEQDEKTSMRGYANSIWIALTAHAGEADQQKALAAGFHKHLAKPIAPETLIKEMISLYLTLPTFGDRNRHLGYPDSREVP